MKKEQKDVIDIPKRVSIQKIDRGLVVKALYENNGDIEKAANQLGISTRTLRNKRKAYDICW